MASMGRTPSLKAGGGAGCATMESFFAPKPKLRRPRGSTKKPKRGRPPKVAEAAAVLALPPPTREANPPSAAAPPTDRPKPSPTPSGLKAPRVDWAAGDHLARLKQAVQGWDTKSGRYEEGMSKTAFAKKVGIPKVTSLLATAPSHPRCGRGPEDKTWQ